MSYKWDELKNEKLRAQRGFTFEEIVVGIEEDGLLAAIAHPNQIRYPNQIVLVVRLGDYAYARSECRGRRVHLSDDRVSQS